MTDFWMKPAFLLKEELKQLSDEGLDVSSVEADIRALDIETSAAEVDVWHERLAKLPRRADFKYHEPSDLEAIRAARPGGPRVLPRQSDDVLHRKYLGAWHGRAAGCQVGKPVEGLHRHDLERYLKAANAFPLQNFVPLLDPAPEGINLHPSAPVATLGNFAEMARDDDMDYCILGTHILEKCGPNFTTEDVGETWLLCVPFHMVYTAERIAYRNLVNEVPTDQVGSYRNPFREWIGAQIRADGWGYAAACAPELAAEFAWRDARLSHVKNGIYGEMWVAAMLAAAFAEPTGPATPDKIHRVIEVGLSEIPAESRVAEAIHDVVAWQREIPDWETCWERINEKYGHYFWVHTINNAALVVMGLLYGGGDFGKSVGIAVMGGWDTDCNGATVGSILGALMGIDAIPSSWVEPMHDSLRSAVIGFDFSHFSDMAQRSFKLHQQAVPG